MNKMPKASKKVIYQATEKSQNPYYQSEFYRRKIQFIIHHTVDTQPSIAYQMFVERKPCKAKHVQC